MTSRKLWIIAAVGFSLFLEATNVSAEEHLWTLSLSGGVSSILPPKRVDHVFPRMAFGLELGYSFSDFFGTTLYYLTANAGTTPNSIGIEPYLKWSEGALVGTAGVRIGFGSDIYFENNIRLLAPNFGPSISLLYEFSEVLAVGPQLVWLYYPREEQLVGNIDAPIFADSYSALHALLKVRMNF